MRSARSGQKEIRFPTHGGKRRGAGRKPAGDRAGVSHASRADVTGREPVLVTLKMRREIWSLRARRVFEKLVPALRAACDPRGLRIVHYSVQRDHIHLIVEPADRTALSRGVQGLCVRIARSLNALMERAGSVFADRYHHRVLATPRQTRHALAYVLGNARKHGHVPPGARGWLDPLSSAPAFDGWRANPGAEHAGLAHAKPPPVVLARTWLLSVGWKRAGGPLDPERRPGAAPS